MRPNDWSMVQLASSSVIDGSFPLSRTDGAGRRSEQLTHSSVSSSHQQIHSSLNDTNQNGYPIAPDASNDTEHDDDIYTELRSEGYTSK